LTGKQGKREYFYSAHLAGHGKNYQPNKGDFLILTVFLKFNISEKICCVMTTWYLIGEWNELEMQLNSSPLDYRIFIKQIVVLHKLLNEGVATLPDGREVEQVLMEYVTIREEMESNYPFLKDQASSPPQQSL
jgi:hypothetical protein